MQYDEKVFGLCLIIYLVQFLEKQKNLIACDNKSLVNFFLT